MFFLSLQGRSHLNHEKEMFAQDHPEVNSLEEVVRLVKPTAIIGRRRGDPLPSTANLLDLQVKTEAQRGGISNPWKHSSFPSFPIPCYRFLLSYYCIRTVELRQQAGLHEAELYSKVEKHRLVSLTRMT